MCGIAGIIGTERSYRVEAADIRRMCHAIVHRGPDDEGVYVQGHVGLGMRRLSIIDLSTGHQPIHNEDRTLWVVFNGEIYNFPELRPELESRGHRFYTNTDTEVILHLYEDYGADCVQRLRGMFAFALWDERSQRLLLARDRFGKKPLHYALSRGRLLFASEIKALLAAAPELLEVNPQGLLNYFHFGYIPDPQSAFIGIQKLPPGHVLEFACGQIRVRQYWDLPSYGTHEPRSEEACLEELEDRLAEAVRIRLISDVPLGALLSGGVDSSTVVALMRRVSGCRVKTFSIGFRNKDFNEADHARLVAQHFETEHHELIVEPKIEETVDKLTRLLEEPFGDSSIVPTYHVSCLARQHVTVALSGDGGDELFAGYDRYMSYLQRRRIRLFFARAGRWYREQVHPRIPTEWRGRRFLFNLSLPPHDRYLDSVSLLPVHVRERSLFSDDFLVWADAQVSPYEPFRRYLERGPASDPLSEVLYLDAKTYLPFDILTKVDRMSMATSLEVRAPLLDHPFAEWAAQLSPRWKMRSGQKKYILRKLAERLGVPRQVLDRPKQGFSMPLVHWFRQVPSPELLDILLEPKTIQRGYFHEPALRGRLLEHRQGRRDRSWEIWHLLIFELWHRNFLEPAIQRETVPVFRSRLSGKETPVTVTASADPPAEDRGQYADGNHLESVQTEDRFFPHSPEHSPSGPGERLQKTRKMRPMTLSESANDFSKFHEISAGRPGSTQDDPVPSSAPLLRAQPCGGITRVLYLVDTLNVGGTESQMAQAALRLHSTRFRVTVACLRAEGPYLELLQRAGIQVVEFPKRKTLLSANGVYQLLRLARFIRRGRFHVVHAYDLWANLLGIPAAWLVRTPIIISSRRYLADLEWYRPWRNRIIRQIYRLSTYVVVNSDAVGELLIQRDDLPREKIRVIYNGVDIERFARAQGNEGRLLHGMDGRRKLIAVVANMYSSVKGHAYLVAAARRVCQNLPEAMFVLIGDGPERPKVEQQVRELGLEKNFVFLGHRKDVGELLVDCDLSVLPSTAEGLPNVVLEAMAAGLPVVATCVGGTPEIIENGISGLLVPSRDPRTLAEAILRVLLDRELANRLGRAGQERVQTRFSFDRLIRCLEELYLTRPMGPISLARAVARS